MDEQLKHLYDYTKFHIGIYITLMTGIIAVLANDKLRDSYQAITPFIMASLILIMLAGACAGLIASSIPYYTSFKKFMDNDISPRYLKTFKINAKNCTHLEHLFFWLGSISCF